MGSAKFTSSKYCSFLQEFVELQSVLSMKSASTKIVLTQLKVYALNEKKTRMYFDFNGQVYWDVK